MTSPSQSDQQTKVKDVGKRTLHACDVCRARRCQYDDQSACRACLASEIPCTQNRPRRRRGPVNQYAKAHQQRQAEQDALAFDVTSRSIDLITPLGAALESPRSPTGVLDKLAPTSTILEVINDWFELVHPVAPILHRDSFLRQLSDFTVSRSLGFTNLVLSLCAATVATLRNRYSIHGGGITVEKCYELATHNVNLTGSQDPFLNMTLEWCQAKYNFAVSLGAVRGIDSPVCLVLLAEATAGVAYLLHYEVDNMDFLSQELVKRLYWLCFAAVSTQGLHGRPHFSILSPSINNSTIQPLDITDTELSTITPGQEQWHGNIVSYIPGLNALSNLFTLWHKSQQINLAHDLKHLQHYIELVLSALDNIPPELRWRGGLSRPLRSNFGTDVQMVNLYITQIHIRSCLLEQMHRVARESGNTNTASWVLNARQSLVDDMLAIVYQMPEIALEANGYSLIPKLRDIGLALLSENTDNSMSRLVNLDRLLAILERLDVPNGALLDRLQSTSPQTSLEKAT